MEARTLNVGMFVMALLMVSCASPETPIHPPGTATSHADLRRDAPPAPPLAPRVWWASVFTRGGFSGAGKGSITVHRDGRADAAACRVRLPEVERLAVESAVAAAQPGDWKRSYVRATSSGRTDQFHYSLSLTVGETEGSVITHSVGWQDDSFDMIPEDLRRLHEALWAARKGLEKSCP